MCSAAPLASAVRSARTWLPLGPWDSTSPGSPGSHVPVNLCASLWRKSRLGDAATAGALVLVHLPRLPFPAFGEALIRTGQSLFGGGAVLLAAQAPGAVIWHVLRWS